VPFARRALDRLEGLGFDAEAGERHLALLFQVRRAYYFIDRALVGTSPSMGELRRQLWNCVFTHDIRWYDRYLLERMEDFSTLILGETGTGKGTAAAAIGRSGFIPFDAARRRFVESFTRSFVAINLSQFPELLIESELFGHRKGAFTGAVDDHRGLLSLCSHRGSVFLDEIGEVGAPVQIKLLQVLQERIFTPVGDHRPQPFRGRVIAATNRPIEELLEGGGFRRDFYYRLCSQTVDVPSLRRRLDEDPGELDALLAHTLERLTGEREPSLLEFVARTIRETLPPDYPWAGNVRELEQCARSILLTRSYRPLAAAAGRSAGERLLEDLESGRLDARELVSRYCARLHERLGTVAEVARRVGLDRRTVKRHIEEGKRGQEPFSGRKGS
jgi:transcriptional regulator with PAS, ATPase and Fis domain